MAERDDEPLAELRLQRHRDLVGRRFGPLVVRGIVLALTLFVVLAAFNVFGQQPAMSQAIGRGVHLDVSTPARVRGGLIFQTRIDVRTSRRIAKPTLVLGGGWFDGMTLNSYQPPATAQAPRGSAVTFTYPPLGAGGRMTVWLEWSVNPTNLAWSRPESIAMDDGATRLVGLISRITVFP